MPERSSKRPKKEHDLTVTAFRVFQEAIGEKPEPATEEAPEPTAEERHDAAVMLGRKGGLKGGKARADKLTPEQKHEIAKKAAAARWQKS